MNVSKLIKSGYELAGDNLSVEELEIWYSQEKEAYFSQNNSNGEFDHWYNYMRFTNSKLFFSLINNIQGQAIFFGPGAGHEVSPFSYLFPKWKLNLIEASDNFRYQLSSKFPDANIIEPQITGSLDFKDSSIDMVCAFCVLHHIANISYAFSEISRVLKPGAYFFLREPCAFMGDWTKARKSTPNERGLSSKYVQQVACKNNLSIVKKIPIVYEPINKIIISKLNPGTNINFNLLYYLDRLISSLLSVNDHYWRDSLIKKIGPSSYSYILQKK